MAWKCLRCLKVLAGWTIFKRKMWKGSSHERTCQVDCGAHFERDWGRKRRIFSQRSLDRLRLTHSKPGLTIRQEKKGNAPIQNDRCTKETHADCSDLQSAAGRKRTWCMTGVWHRCWPWWTTWRSQDGDVFKSGLWLFLKHESLRKRSSHFVGKI